mmetsp:Transcript_64376/g.199370  ORF Transcript_64376/g.199370 Transcript_64376/m.199370 type:complete len:132 (-) Transcript_64376:145-540(-)
MLVRALRLPRSPAGPRPGGAGPHAARFHVYMSAKEVDEQMLRVRNKNSASFVERFANNIMGLVADFFLPVSRMTAAFVGTFTGGQRMLRREAECFTAMCRRMASFPLEPWRGDGREGVHGGCELRGCAVMG